MIQYKSGRWSVSILFRLKGSVFPRAMVWAFPAAGISALFYYVWFELLENVGLEQASAVGAIWASFTFILGFLVVFRTQQAYSRYWEGATLVQQARANFFNATSSVIAFCAKEKRYKKPVDEFQHLLVRLMSMLHCLGLQTVAEMRDVQFEFFNTEGIDEHSLEFLTSHNDSYQRCEIVVQWIQRLVIDANQKGLLDVPSPILTRFFQELAQGAVHIINARNMTGIPFPFPYAQMLTGLLVAYCLVSPFFTAALMQNPLWSGILTFISVFAFWGTNYIAAEIESPFGDDPNDLPLHSLQKDLNKSLWVLLEPRTQSVPKFVFDKERHRTWDVVHMGSVDQGGSTARLSEVSRKLLESGKSKLWLAKGTGTADLESDILRLPTRSSVSGSRSMENEEDDQKASGSQLEPIGSVSGEESRPLYISESMNVSSVHRPQHDHWSMDRERAMDSCIRGLSEVLADSIGRTIRDLNKIHQGVEVDYREMGVPPEFHQAGNIELGGLELGEQAAAHLVTTPRLLGGSSQRLTLTTPRSAKGVGLGPSTPKT